MGDRSVAGRGQLRAGSDAGRSDPSVVQRVEGGPRARLGRPLAPSRRVRGAARRPAGSADRSGQRNLEAAVRQGAALPSGRGVSRPFRSSEHDDLLDGP